MNYRMIIEAVDNRSLVRVTDRAGAYKGLVGIALGYNAAYHTLKVGMIDSEWRYTGESTRVPADCLELVRDEPAAQAVEAQPEAGLDELLAETEAAIPAPITDRHGITWTWKTGNIFRDGTGRAWPREFIKIDLVIR